MSARSRKKDKDLRPPKEIPGPSQQGSIGSCVAHALAKCVCQAGEKHTPRINFLQSEVIPQVIQLGGDNAAKNGSWPDGLEWNGKYILPKENGTDAAGGPYGKTYKTTLRIQKCEVADYDDRNEHVLIFRTDQCPGLSAESGLHCVYITRKSSRYWNFWNSHGEQQKVMKMEINNPDNVLYKVAVDIEDFNSDTSEGKHGGKRKHDCEEDPVLLVLPKKELLSKPIMDSDKEEDEYNEAKDKFEKVFEKLKKQMERQQKSILNKTIGDVKKAWKDLEGLQSNYVKHLRKAGNREEAARVNTENVDMEADMDEKIRIAEEYVSEGDKAEPKKRTAEEQVEIVDRENMDEEMAEEVLLEEEPKKKTKGIIQKMKEGAQQLKEGVENVGNNIANTLSKILVSKKQYDDFQIQLKDALVSEWDETSESKVFTGVQVSRYDDFLKLFKKSTKVDDEILAEFETMEFSDRMDDKVKTFSCKGTDTGGKYGLYMAVKWPGEEKIDVAYAMYTYKAKFVGGSVEKRDQYKVCHAESAKDGLYRLTKPAVENVLTGKMMEPDRFFKKADIDELAENFIVAKALQAFAHYGIIQKVSYFEDENKNIGIEKQSKEMLEDKTR